MKWGFCLFFVSYRKKLYSLHTFKDMLKFVVIEVSIGD